MDFGARRLAISSRITLVMIICLTGCRSSAVGTLNPTPEDNNFPNTADLAVVQSISISGNPGNYTFAVTISSQDLGCERYTDWWEVIGLEGELIYRRILLHSHVAEQPFTRSGGPVEIMPDETVIVRAHFHPEGYAEAGVRGSIDGGFEKTRIDLGISAELEKQSPFPLHCDF
jgi:hypothetical protein